MRTVLVTLLLAVSTAVAVAPTASADLCLTDSDCFPPPVECIQVIPWSYLCSGDVKSFVRHFVDLGDVLA